MSAFREDDTALRTKLPTRVTLTDGEKSSLIELGRALGAPRELITVAPHRTFTRWAAPDGRELAVKLVTEDRWGYTRRRGE